MGFAGWILQRGSALKVRRSDRVFPTPGLTSFAFFCFCRLRNALGFSLNCLDYLQTCAANAQATSPATYFITLGRG